jgi:ribulose-phosphate 3-epimerase
MVAIAPSILSADFGRLAEEVRDVEAGGADYIHVDVMDGHFVPNITLGPLIVKAVRASTRLPLDVHLMIDNPERYIDDFVRAGADYITVHAEASRHLHRTIQRIKEHGIKAGVALNPHTPLEIIKHVIPEVDLVLLMTVNPGFGGQSFIPAVLDKIRELRLLADKYKPELEIEVDGGIQPETARACREAGANVLVAGSGIYDQPNRRKAIADIRGL